MSMKQKIIPDLTAVVSTVGEATFKDCVESIKNQTMLPAKIEFVENITPLSKAYKTRLIHAKTKYYLQVDADMILNKNAISVLYKKMQNTTNCFLVKSYLKDDLIGRIGFLKLFNRELIGNLKIPDVIGIDRYVEKKLKDSGYKEILLDINSGYHINTFNRQFLFLKFKRYAEKSVVFGDSIDSIVKKLSFRIGKEWDLMVYYALFGYIIGFLTSKDDLKKELNLDKERESKIFEVINSLLMRNNSEFKYFLNQSEVFYKQGLNHLSEKYLEDAENYINSGQDTSVINLYNIGSFLQSVNKLDKSSFYFNEILRKSKVISTEIRGGVYFHLGEIEFIRKNKILSKEYFLKCVDCIPDHRKALNYLL